MWGAVVVQGGMMFIALDLVNWLFTEVFTRVLGGLQRLGGSLRYV